MEFAAVTTALGNLGSVMDTVLTTIAANPYLMLFMAVPVLAVGCKSLRKLVKARAYTQKKEGWENLLFLTISGGLTS